MRMCWNTSCAFHADRHLLQQASEAYAGTDNSNNSPTNSNQNPHAAGTVPPMQNAGYRHLMAAGGGIQPGGTTEISSSASSSGPGNGRH
jgi:hypothetical protein